MLARAYVAGSVASAPLNHGSNSSTRRATRSPWYAPGGYLALLLAPQTEKDLPAGYGYLDHAFFGYIAASRAGFLPERRISCPMDGGYVPQQVRRARVEGECSARSATCWWSAGLCISGNRGGCDPVLGTMARGRSTSPGMMSHQEAMGRIPDVGTRADRQKPEMP